MSKIQKKKKKIGKMKIEHMTLQYIEQKTKFQPSFLNNYFNAVNFQNLNTLSL